MDQWTGNRNPDDPQEGYYVGLMNACGYRTEDLKKPVIGIANSYTDVNPGHRAFKQLVEFVKEGIWAAGGIPAEFNVPAPCDGMAQGDGMHTVLPQRDLISASIEAMARAHGFDGMVFLCSCDKIVPGMLMAAAALDRPSLFLTAGSMMPYESDQGTTFVTPDLKESIGAYNIDQINEETFTCYRENICHPVVHVQCTAQPTRWGCLRRSSGSVPSTAQQCSSAPAPKASRPGMWGSVSSR